LTESQIKEWLEKWVKTQQSKRLYSVEEAADYLGLKPRTIYNGIGPKSKKPFPVQPKRYGGKPLFEKVELDLYADSLPR
jgi:predicted DNA-binding transcriptional regulator AlpA